MREAGDSRVGGYPDRICRLKRLHVGAARHLVASPWSATVTVQLDSLVRERLLTASASTLDRLLKPDPVHGCAAVRRGAVGNSTWDTRRSSGTDLQRLEQAPTGHTWSLEPGGPLAAGLIVQGSFIHSLVVTDDLHRLDRGRPPAGQRPGPEFLAGLDSHPAPACPGPIRGIDSDNDGAFINR